MSPMRPLEINIREEKGATIVTMAGHISSSDGDTLKHTFETIVAGRPKVVIVDVEGVELITSDGLGVLIRAHKAVAAQGGHFLLANVLGNVRDVFKMTKLDQVFPIYDSIQEAFAETGL